MPKKVRKKSAFTNKSAQKSTLKSTFGSSEPIWEIGQSVFVFVHLGICKFVYLCICVFFNLWACVFALHRMGAVDHKTGRQEALGGGRVDPHW